MAEVVPNEGLDLILGLFPRGGSAITSTNLGLFQGLTASTVPAAAAVLSDYGAAAGTTITEASFASYARQSIASGSWGAQAAGTGNASGGRQSSAAQVSFPAATATYSTAINGFFLANQTAHGTPAAASDKAYFYANFDDTTAIATMAIGDVIKVTPTFGLLP